MTHKPDDKEQWKVVEDFPSYMVSSHGRLKQHVWKNPQTPPRMLVNYFPPRIKGEKQLRSIVLTNPEHQKVSVHLHRLVANAFLPRRPSDDHILAHLDYDKNNNRASNLAWMTRRELAQKRLKDGVTRTRTRPKKRGQAISDYHAVKIISEYQAGSSSVQLARKYGVSASTIKAIVSGASFPHIMEQQ